jgi:hypothetical protein
MNATDATQFKELLRQAMQRCNIRECVLIFDYKDDTAPMGGTGIIHTSLDQPTPAYLHMAMQINTQIQQIQRMENQKQHNIKAQKN